jgi:para-aminobenzoate synthetase/4-amino-4-deoxychorismate lyase
MTSARFDDLTPGSEHGFVLSGLVDEVVANRPDEVAAALAGIEDATSRGLWAAGYLAYEAAAGLDPALPVHAAQDGRPPVHFGLYRGRVEATPLTRLGSAAGYEVSDWEPGMDQETFAGAVAAIRDAIAAGDTYQVNLTFPLRARFAGDPAAWYADLARGQRGAFNAHLEFGDRHLLSASPELFFSVDGDVITTRPMKGTVRRGRWTEEDAALAARLAGSGKDRAENVMIVDLLRSDLGRIAEVGSVAVDRLFAVERYETVWQLTSTVSARLRPGATLTDVLRALFPSGSVTGAPKRSTMQVIRALEPAQRGPYCGAIGFVAPTPPQGGIHAVFNVPIRTVDLDLSTGGATYGVGCGITWGSDAAGEYEEARWKAQLLTAHHPDFDLVETLAWAPDEGFRHLDRHLDRLDGSAGYFGFAVDRSAVARSLHGTVAGMSEQLRVRVTAARSGEVHIEAAPLDARHPGPVRFVLAPLPLAPDDALLFHKTTAREQYRGPRRLHPDADDVLLVNDRGELTEFTVANVALLLDGVWCTPPLESGLLPGTYRAELVEQGAITERVLTVADLEAAEEVAWFNSLRGRRRAQLIGTATEPPVAAVR